MQEIYYVDDDVDDIDIFTHAINTLKQKRSLPVKLHVFTNGDSLLHSVSQLKERNGNTIFLDINMPGKTGFEVLHEIKNNDNLSWIPVVMYSTSSDINIINKSKSLGADLYAIKPNGFNEMNDLIIKVLNIDWAKFETNDDNFVINKA